MSIISRIRFAPAHISFACAIGLLIPLPGVLSAQELVPIAGKRDDQWNNVETLPPPLMSQDADPSEVETSGRAELIRQRYPDGEVQVKRQVMQDLDGNYLNHGPWYLYNRRGQVMAEGQFENGSMSGTWTRWHPTGSQGLFAESPFDQFQGPFLSVASFTDGQLDGVWTVFDRSRRKILEISYQKGKRHGDATWFWPDGERMRRVSFADGKLDGELIQWDRQNEVTKRESYRQGKQLITKTTWHRRNQKQTEDKFLGEQLETVGHDDWWNARPASYERVGQEIQHGTSSAWYSNGQLKMRGQYEDGLRVGQFQWWHENGQKQISGAYRDGLKDSRWTWWHANGMKAIEGNYTDDQAEGIWTWWMQTGEIKRQEDFSELIVPAESGGK